MFFSVLVCFTRNSSQNILIFLLVSYLDAKLLTSLLKLLVETGGDACMLALLPGAVLDWRQGLINPDDVALQ